MEKSVLDIFQLLIKLSFNPLKNTEVSNVIVKALILQALCIGLTGIRETNYTYKF